MSLLAALFAFFSFSIFDCRGIGNTVSKFTHTPVNPPVHTTQPAPEPATVGILGVGAVSLIALRRKGAR